MARTPAEPDRLGWHPVRALPPTPCHRDRVNTPAPYRFHRIVRRGCHNRPVRVRIAVRSAESEVPRDFRFPSPVAAPDRHGDAMSRARRWHGSASTSTKGSTAITSPNPTEGRSTTAPMVFSHPQSAQQHDRSEQANAVAPPRNPLFREPSNPGQVRPAA